METGRDSARTDTERPRNARQTTRSGRPRGEGAGRPRCGTARDTVHAFVGRDRGWYFAECAEIAIVTQGRTLDELVANLREAVGLHLEGGDAGRLGLAAQPRLVLTYETRLGP